MTQLELFRVRNFHGYHQYYDTYELGDREVSRWIFIICGFSFDDLYANMLMFDGSKQYVPINEANEILINGTWYGPEHWHH
jgi:hypothetical protein